MQFVSKVGVSLLVLMMIAQCSGATAQETKVKTGLDLLREGKFALAHTKLQSELTLEKNEVKRARLLDRQGQALEAQGKFDRAQKLFTQSMELRKNSGTKQDDLEDARSYLNLGRLYLKLGNFQKADGYLNRSLETAHNIGLIKGGSIVSEAKRFISELHIARGNSLEASTMSNEAIALRRERSTKEAYAQKMAECLTSVAHAELSMGSHSKALVAAETAIAVGDSADRKNRTGLAERLETLAEVHIASGSGSRANEPANRTWELRKSELGSKHPAVARSLLLCGHSYLQLKDYKRAEKCYRDSFEIASITLGDKHPQVAAALMGLASVRLAQGRVQESQNDYHRAMSIYASIYGANHQVVAFHKKLYKDLLWQTDYWQEALSLPDTTNSTSVRSAANLDGTLLAASIAGIEPPKTSGPMMGAKQIFIAVSILCAILFATACVLIIPTILASLVGNNWTPSEGFTPPTHLGNRTNYSPTDDDAAVFGKKPQPKRVTKEQELISFEPPSNEKKLPQTPLGTSKLGKKTQKDFIPRWNTNNDNNVERWW